MKNKWNNRRSFFQRPVASALLYLNILVLISRS